MKKIMRVIIAGIIASLVTILFSEIDQGKLLPDTIEGSLQIVYDLFYSNREIIIFILAFALIFFTFAGLISDRISSEVEKTLKKYPMQEILMYIIGLAIGLGLANLVESAISTDRYTSITIIWTILLYLGLGSFGVYLVHLKKEEIKGWVSKKGIHTMITPPKILDTSVIIDGRILDIVKTKFIEGKIIIPSFVLDELRHIADSSDKLRRSKGRRGLDILKEIQNTKDIPVEIVEIDYKELEEVDSKLIKLATELQALVVTNDFNLNKVAQLQQVVVLNINDLANAVKPVVLPSEEMIVTIVKEGKEQEQGIAYLNDGTMIVVEGGKKYVGETKTVCVTTVLQTSAGRMIFAKILK